MEMVQDDFSRQVNILDPEEFKTPIHIIGAGATGSWLAFSLAKMGIQNLHIYDFDEVGMHNLPNQMFGIRNIDKNKALTIKQIIRQFTGYKVKAHDVKIDGTQPLQGIVFMLTDTMASRKNIYELAIRNNPNIELLIETRMDLRGGRIYALDPKDKDQCQKYEETLYSDDEAEVSACGVSQTVLPTALGIISNAIWKMLNYINKESFPSETLVDFSNEVIMTQSWIDEKAQRRKYLTREDMLGKTFNCLTKGDALEFAELCHEFNMKWASGESLKNALNWDDYRSKTCYTIDRNGDVRYSDTDYYKGIGREYIMF